MLLSNYQVTARARAAEHRRLADEARAVPPSGWGLMDEKNADEVRDHSRLAARWEERAKYAAQGMATVHTDEEGLRHRWEYHELIDQAASEHRLVHFETDDQQQVGAARY
jgi:hypothetical protein